MWIATDEWCPKKKPLQSGEAGQPPSLVKQFRNVSLEPCQDIYFAWIMDTQEALKYLRPTDCGGSSVELLAPFSQLVCSASFYAPYLHLTAGLRAADSLTGPRHFWKRLTSGSAVVFLKWSYSDIVWFEFNVAMQPHESYCLVTALDVVTLNLNSLQEVNFIELHQQGKVRLGIFKQLSWISKSSLIWSTIDGVGVA